MRDRHTNNIHGDTQTQTHSNIHGNTDTLKKNQLCLNILEKSVCVLLCVCAGIVPQEIIIIQKMRPIPRETENWGKRQRQRDREREENLPFETHLVSP